MHRPSWVREDVNLRATLLAVVPIPLITVAVLWHPAPLIFYPLLTLAMGFSLASAVADGRATAQRRRLAVHHATHPTPTPATDHTDPEELP